MPGWLTLNRIDTGDVDRIVTHPGFRYVAVLAAESDEHQGRGYQHHFRMPDFISGAIRNMYLNRYERPLTLNCQKFSRMHLVVFYRRSGVPARNGGEWQASGSRLACRIRCSAISRRRALRSAGRDPHVGSDSTTVLAVTVETGESIKVGATQALFKLPQGTIELTASPDGKRFLATMLVPGREQSALSVVVNWDAGLRKP